MEPTVISFEGGSARQTRKQWSRTRGGEEKMDARNLCGCPNAKIVKEPFVKNATNDKKERRSGRTALPV